MQKHLWFFCNESLQSLDPFMAINILKQKGKSFYFSAEIENKPTSAVIFLSVKINITMEVKLGIFFSEMLFYEERNPSASACSIFADLLFL